MAALTIQQAFELALQHHQAGRLRDAEQLYRHILTQQPTHAGALHYMGLIAHQMGRHEVAVELIRQAIALRPGYVEAHNNLGNALRDRGQLDEAIAAYQQAITLRPDYAEARYNLGNALKDRGQLDEAIACYRQAVALRPGYVEAHYNLGNALKYKGRLDESVAAYRQAIALRPGYAEAHSNLGSALKDQGQLDEAAACCRQAIALRPGYAEAHHNLGNVLKDLGQPDEAVAALQQAIALRPGFAEAYSNLGNALKDRGQLEEAIAAFRHAITLNPNLRRAHSNLIYALHYHAGQTAEIIRDELRQWKRQYAEPLKGFIQPHTNNRNPDRRLRIGYVSADFRTHASAHFLVPLLEHHDPQQVELVCYDQGSRPDAITRRLQQHASQWRSTSGLSDQQLAAQIRQDRIDILVDLKLHTENNRLLVFAHKPAPVQVTWLGYPGSTGLDTIDYRLSDPYLDPPGMDESVHTEQTIRLPDSFWCYDPLDGRELSVNSLPALQAGAVTFGCLNNFCKINDGILAIWERVLVQTEGSRLLLLAPQGSHRQRMMEQLSGAGIDPGRIEFVSRQPRRKYLEMYHRIDLGLDSFPCNGHTTSLDSFWMGVPVVTLVGQTAFSRAGWCQLSNLGLAELAGHTPEQFVRLAVELAQDLPRLNDLRSTLRQRMEQSPLMDAPKFARNIEAAYRQMWRSWCGEEMKK